METARRARCEGSSGGSRISTIDRLLSSPSSALLLSDAVGENRIRRLVRTQVLASAQKLPDATVRDLFERFVPDEQRVKRLGSVIKPETILSLKGDVARGREMFFKSSGLQCVNCHRVNGTGSTFGPELSQIGKKERTHILESLLDPSKVIEPQWQTYLLETTDGKVYTGLLKSKSDTEVVLNLPGDKEIKEIRVATGKVERLAPQAKSMMPELLLRDLTAEQAADLLAFLMSLK